MTEPDWANTKESACNLLPLLKFYLQILEEKQDMETTSRLPVPAGTKLMAPLSIIIMRPEVPAAMLNICHLSEVMKTFVENHRANPKRSVRHTKHYIKRIAFFMHNSDSFKTRIRNYWRDWRKAYMRAYLAITGLPLPTYADMHLGDIIKQKLKETENFGDVVLAPRRDASPTRK
jgi:hypothetical protein